MLNLILELIKFPFKLIGYIVSGFFWMLGSILVRGKQKDDKNVAVGVLLVLSAVVAFVYYGVSQRTAESMWIAIGIFGVLFLLIAGSVALFRLAEK